MTETKTLSIHTIEIVSGKNLDATIGAILRELGVPANLKGYRCLKEAIKTAVKDSDTMQSITGRLYPRVADICGTTASRAERAIRHAIECAWDRGDIDVLHSFFGNTVSMRKGKPTNAQFISLAVEYITMQQAQ